MQKNVSFEMEEAVEVPEWASVYPEHKFTVFKACFLSTKPNSHELNITPEVLREYAPTMLGNFLVAKIENADCTTHKSDEIIYGYAPREQEIEFVEDGEVLKAYCYFVVSKRYSKEFNGVFEFNNLRNSSVEMKVETPTDDEHTVLSFDLFGLTTLGRFVNGSCPDANIKMVRFSEKKAEAYFKKSTNLKQFVNERKQGMAETIVNNDESIIEMGEVIIDNSEGKEDTKMNEIEFAAVNLEDLWSRVYDYVHETRHHYEYCINGIFEEDNQKFAILRDRDGKLYRLNFSLTEEGFTAEEEVTEVMQEFIVTENIKQFAELENAEVMAKYTQFEEKEPDESDPEPEAQDENEGEGEDEVKMSIEEMATKMEQMAADIEARDNIIMENEAELTELRAFKAGIEAKEKAMAVEAVMEEVKTCLSDEQFAEFREEGLASVEFDAWANKVRATCFSALKKAPKKAETVFSFSAPVETVKEAPKDVWERLRNHKN